MLLITIRELDNNNKEVSYIVVGQLFVFIKEKGRDSRRLCFYRKKENFKF
jgi:hypothetical protein